MTNPGGTQHLLQGDRAVVPGIDAHVELPGLALELAVDVVMSTVWLSQCVCKYRKHSLSRTLSVDDAEDFCGRVSFWLSHFGVGSFEPANEIPNDFPQGIDLS